MIKKITIQDFERAFGEELSSFVREKISGFVFEYEEVQEKEKDLLVLSILKSISAGLRKAGPHRAQDWVHGWAENRDEVKQSIKPKYFGKLPHVRWQGKFIKPISEDFEYNMAQVLQFWLFEKYMSGSTSIYEFGCGTAHNLLRAEEVSPAAKLYGLDWATSSQETIREINKLHGKDIQGHNFNFFEIDHSLKLDASSTVYTFAALEQVGENHTDFIDYLIEQNPSICLHVEPIAELLDPESNLLDHLSVEYFRERNYLRNFYNHLKDLETSGKIEIIKAQRSQIGSFYVDGYSIVAWRPKCQN